MFAAPLPRGPSQGGTMMPPFGEGLSGLAFLRSSGVPSLMLATGGMILGVPETAFFALPTPNVG